MGGFSIGMARLVAELNKSSLSGWLHTFASINFLYFAIILFACSIALMVVISLLTAEPSYDKIQGLTYATTVAEDKARSRASWDLRDITNSLIIIAVIAFTLIYFSG